MNEPKIQSNPEVRIPVREMVPGHPERRAEVPTVSAEQSIDTQSSEVAVAIPPVPVHPTSFAPTKDPALLSIEHILADGMDSAYTSMDAATQVRFKQVGEATAVTLARMMEQTKIQVKKIVQIILVWLRIIPNVNPFYLEQEAKIKADALLALKKPPSDISPLT